VNEAELIRRISRESSPALVEHARQNQQLLDLSHQILELTEAARAYASAQAASEQGGPVDADNRRRSTRPSRHREDS